MVILIQRSRKNYYVMDETLSDSSKDKFGHEEIANNIINLVVLAQKLWDDYLVLDISNSFKKKYSSSG